MSYFDNNISLYPNYKDDYHDRFIQDMNTYLLYEDEDGIKNETKMYALWNGLHKIIIDHSIYIKDVEQLKRDLVYYMYIKDQEHIR